MIKVLKRKESRLFPPKSNDHKVSKQCALYVGLNYTEDDEHGIYGRKLEGIP